MPRSFLIKKHVNAGATALPRPVAVVKRPWLDDSSHEAEDLSTSPPTSSAGSSGLVTGALRQLRSRYRAAIRPQPKGEKIEREVRVPIHSPASGHHTTTRGGAYRSQGAHPSETPWFPSWSSGVSSSSSDEKESRGSPVPSERPRRRPENAPRYPCTGCNRSYSTYSGLSKHRQFHCSATTSKSFSCKYCEKDYSSLGALKMHIRTHTLPCKCKLCGKAFSRPWLLQGHIRTHTGEKPFACPHCSRAFADRSNLRAHLQTHSDIKKYSCKSCSRTFSRMSLLLKHEDGGCPAAALNRSQPKP
ncbi:hypothetical protein MRX96_058258 [Rhipicephalus microplus]